MSHRRLVRYCVSLICFHQDTKWLNMAVLHTSGKRNFCFFVCWNKQYGCYTENTAGLIRNSCTKHRNLFIGAIWAGRHRRMCVRFAQNEINEHRGHWGKSISNKPTLLHIPLHSAIDFSLRHLRQLSKWWSANSRCYQLTWAMEASSIPLPLSQKYSLSPLCTPCPHGNTSAASTSGSFSSSACIHWGYPKSQVGPSQTTVRIYTKICYQTQNSDILS